MCPFRFLICLLKHFKLLVFLVDETFEPLLCRLEDGVVFITGLNVVMFHGVPLMKRVNEIIDRVFGAGLNS
jgi:hypothetical protein